MYQIRTIFSSGGHSVQLMGTGRRPRVHTGKAQENSKTFQGQIHIFQVLI